MVIDGVVGYLTHLWVEINEFIFLLLSHFFFFSYLRKSHLSKLLGFESVEKRLTLEKIEYNLGQSYLL